MPSPRWFKDAGADLLGRRGDLLFLREFCGLSFFRGRGRLGLLGGLRGGRARARGWAKGASTSSESGALNRGVRDPSINARPSTRRRVDGVEIEL